MAESAWAATEMALVDWACLGTAQPLAGVSWPAVLLAMSVVATLAVELLWLLVAMYL